MGPTFEWGAVKVSSWKRVTILSAASMLSSLSLSKPKRTKTSGLTSVELRVAYSALLKMKAGLKRILVLGSNETPSGLVAMETDFEETLDSLIQSLEIKVEQTDVCLLLCQTCTFTYHCLHPLSFSGMTHKLLFSLNISRGGGIKLKTDAQERATTLASQGQYDVWSSTNLYRHLCFLDEIVPQPVSA